ncbi:MAG: arylsulfatase [Zavarzinella sp.]
MKILLSSIVLILGSTALRAADKPNIIFILCDDLGYGDVKCYNPEGKIPTPNMDRLAKEGMRFTDAHSPSAVCSPTRYGIMTGRYAWRSKLQRGVLGGLSPRLIEKDRQTVAGFLKNHGYHTACIGKWHLGMDWVVKPGKSVNPLSIESREQVFNVDYDQPISNGPNAVGFDYYFGISASLDMVPYTFIENNKVVKSPTEDRDFAMMFGKAQGRCRKGPTAPGFEVEDVLPTLTSKAITYVQDRAKEKKPFFLYLPYASPHTPIAPTKEWQGKSKLNPYADFVMQTDDCIGQLLKQLDESGIAKNTLVICTSDNGCSPQADFAALEAKGHHPSGPLRGHKADIFEGGHRVPFLVRWPEKLKAGTTSSELVNLVDLFATCAEIIDQPLPATAAVDSVSLLPALGITSDGKPRTTTIVHSINGSFAIRDGKWKLALCPDSGGWSAPRPGKKATILPDMQLFDLSRDLAERTNLVEEHTERVAEMAALLEMQVIKGRSTPGKPTTNTVPVDIFKFSPKKK